MKTSVLFGFAGFLLFSNEVFAAEVVYDYATVIEAVPVYEVVSNGPFPEHDDGVVAEGTAEYERVTGYHVRYRYNNTTFFTRTAVDPGDTIRVRLILRPVEPDRRVPDR